MLIDWFTVGAQALNFVVLVALLKRFLYRPVLDAIDSREARIAAQLSDAQALQAQAQAARTQYEQQQQALAAQHAALQRQAVDEAGAERERLLAAARQAADALAARRQAALQAETDRLQQALDERAGAEVFAIARQALVDLAGAELEALVVDRFIARLAALDGPARAAFAAALAGNGAVLQVRSAFDLPTAQRQALEAALQPVFGISASPRYETLPALVVGIELVVCGRQLAWGVTPYLAALSRTVQELLTPPGKTPATTTATATVPAKAPDASTTAGSAAS